MGRRRTRWRTGPWTRDRPLFDDVETSTRRPTTPAGPCASWTSAGSAPPPRGARDHGDLRLPHRQLRTQHHSHPRRGGSVEQHHGSSDESRMATPAHHEEQHQASSDDRTEATDRVQDHHGNPGGPRPPTTGAGAPGGRRGRGTAAGGAGRARRRGTSGDEGDHIADAHRSKQGHAPGEAAEQVHTGALRRTPTPCVWSPTATPSRPRMVTSWPWARRHRCSRPASRAPRSAPGRLPGGARRGTVRGSASAPSTHRTEDSRMRRRVGGGRALDQGLGAAPASWAVGPPMTARAVRSPERSTPLPRTVGTPGPRGPATWTSLAFGTESEDTLAPAPVRAAVDGDDDPAGAPQVATATDASLVLPGPARSRTWTPMPSRPATSRSPWATSRPASRMRSGTRRTGGHRP
ncbi:hypothetical protein QJS66_08575 [Kocuria rhizophila]|nr:hypothetical protein QJS66_08575 [Kocuria rhizophila]